MKTINVRLSKFQREELSYKLDIMEEGFADDGTVNDGYMAHYYGFTIIGELAAMQAKLTAVWTAPSAIVELDEREARTAWGEFENAYDIAADNAQSDGEPNGDHGRAAKRLKQAMERIEEAAAAAGFNPKTSAEAAQ